ncbi:hypothetical protein [uncultured Herbaspirillum sp.]|uniref:hypothetical protein n=1 Tax=uncultured Herbaspirillum sp. TaxID=160236 RepID=UPI002584DA43|nr:hypothetical protein [uncultured Herbaspirillum sp.]
MISESRHWKKPLLETAKRLTALKTSRNVSEQQLVRFEKDIFMGFYSVRKLFETQTKITDAVRQTTLELSWYPNVGTEVTWRNNHKLDELYDFNKPGREKRDVWFVCGRLIHSFVFVPVFGELGGIEAVFFTSDTDKDKRLYGIHIDKIIDLFHLVGSDAPMALTWKRDPKTGQELTIVE